MPTAVAIANQRVILARLSTRICLIWVIGLSERERSPIAASRGARTR
jgi:hypothetical protein